MKMVKHIFDNNTLAPSQYRAILTLLYKKGERENIANWRPISLLNTDYKIITKVLAERLKIFLPKLIHPDQKGFITGRNIADANRLLQDAVEYSEQRGINSSIIFLDYNKAFDRVEWQWVLKSLISDQTLFSGLICFLKRRKLVYLQMVFEACISL